MRSRRSATSTRRAVEKVAAENGIPQALTDFDALIALDLDLVSICTPSALHFEQAEKALRAGRNVVLEKPFASSLAEADALAEIERDSGKRLCPVFQYRFADGLAQLFHLRERGFVGKAYASTVETHWRRLPAYYDNPWRGRWASELGGCLITHAIHNHDMLTYVLGPIKSVYARTATRVNPIETEDCAAAVLEMADGSFATLSVTLGAEEDMSRLRFCFAGLTAESNHSPYNPGTAPWRFIAADPERQQAIDAAVAEVAPAPDRYTSQFLRLHKALDRRRPAARVDRRRAAVAGTGHRGLSFLAHRPGRATADRPRPSALPGLAAGPHNVATWGAGVMANLELRGVVKRFGAVEVIHGVDLKIEDGEFTVFVGPSGCGKSTLLRMIAGLEEVSGGEVLYRRRTGQRCRRSQARACHGVPVLCALSAYVGAQEPVVWP